MDANTAEYIERLTRTLVVAFAPMGLIALVWVCIKARIWFRDRSE